MKNIDFLENGGGGFRLRYTRAGEPVETPLVDPRELHFQNVLMILQEGHVPMPMDMDHLPIWMPNFVFEHWRAAWDLPTFNDARRLCYMVDNYRAAAAADLLTYTHLDLGELWRARRWTMLLDVLDRLPPHGWFNATLAMDEKHAEMMAASVAARQASGDAEEDKTSGPPLTSWTPEVAAITTLTDAVNSLRHAVIAVQVGNKAGDPPKPMPRPVTPFQIALKNAEYARKKAKHESLVARLLPNR